METEKPSEVEAHRYFPGSSELNIPFIKSDNSKVLISAGLGGMLFLILIAHSQSQPKYPSSTQGYYAQELDWKSCYYDYQCADLLVPIDYEKLSTGTFKISLLKFQAIGAKKLGSIVVNHGGPGSSGEDYAYSAQYIFSTDILDKYDIVGFDPRGVSRSEPIVCLTEQELDANYTSDSKPDNDKEFHLIIKDTKKFIEKCRNNNKHLEAFSTANAARDMDILRQAIGDKQLNYMGKSYGTYLGTIYAQFFPDKVGRLVLDGAVDPTISNYQQSLTQALGFDHAFNAFHKDCLKRKDCTLPPDKSAAIKEMQKLFNQAEEKPLQTLRKSKRTVSETLLVLGTASAMYDSESGWPKLRKAINQAKNGYGDKFLALADDYTGRKTDGTYPNNESDAGAIIDCLDFNESRSPDQIRKDAPSFAKAAPLFGPYLAYGGLTCKYFHPKKEINIALTKTANPIIVIGTTGDPATPYEWAQGLHKLLTNSILISLTGEGHTGQGQGSACIDDQIDDFYLTKKLPVTSTCN